MHDNKMDHDPIFVSGTSIIKQFILLLLDFRHTVNHDQIVFNDAIWFSIMVRVMDRIRTECYLSDESSTNGVELYPIENIVEPGIDTAFYPNNCVLCDPTIGPTDVVDSGVVIDMSRPTTVVNVKKFARNNAIDHTNAEFIDLAYTYVVTNFKQGKYVIYANIILMHTLVTIFNEEVLDSYYTMVNLATPLIDCTATTLMRNIALNMFLRIMAESWSVKLPVDMCEQYNEFYNGTPLDGVVRLRVSCKYQKEEFTMDGTDIFKCKIIPSHISIGAVQPE